MPALDHDCFLSLYIKCSHHMIWTSVRVKIIVFQHALRFNCTYVYDFSLKALSRTITIKMTITITILAFTPRTITITITILAPTHQLTITLYLF